MEFWTILSNTTPEVHSAKPSQAKLSASSLRPVWLLATAQSCLYATNVHYTLLAKHLIPTRAGEVMVPSTQMMSEPQFTQMMMNHSASIRWRSSLRRLLFSRSCRYTHDTLKGQWKLQGSRIADVLFWEKTHVQLGMGRASSCPQRLLRWPWGQVPLCTSEVLSCKKRGSNILFPTPQCEQLQMLFQRRLLT